LKAAKSKPPSRPVRRPEPMCLYSVTEVAEQCHVSPKTVRRLIANGMLGSVRVGRSVRVPHAELVRHLKRIYGAVVLT
jgi:excisionase family DNA binding protein